MATIATLAELEKVRRQPSLAFQINQASSSAESVVVKGFVSTDSPDRTGLRIEPQEFDLPGFMAAPAVLVNHALWSDEQGVKGGVGTPISVHIAKVRRGIEPGTFSIYDTQSQREIDVVKKELVPNLRIGVQGVYAFVKITNPDVVRMVASGELKAFSWRGVGNWGHSFEGGTAYRTLRGIDLWEISLVTMPANNESYAVMRSAIQGVTSAEDVTLKSLTGKVSQFNSHDSVTSSELIRMVGGLSVILSSPGTSQEVASSMETPMSTQTPASEGQAAPQAVPEPVQVAPAQQQAVQSAPTSEPVASSAAPQALAGLDPTVVAAAVAAQLAPILSPLAETLRGLAETVTALKKTPEAAPAATPEPATPAASEPAVDPTAELIRSLTAEVTQLKGLVGNITPPAREPRGEGGAPLPKADPNAVFDSFFAPLASRTASRN
jgi:hypothetical protein